MFFCILLFSALYQDPSVADEGNNAPSWTQNDTSSSWAGNDSAPSTSPPPPPPRSTSPPPPSSSPNWAEQGSSSSQGGSTNNFEGDSYKEKQEFTSSQPSVVSSAPSTQEIDPFVFSSLMMIIILSF